MNMKHPISLSSFSLVAILGAARSGIAAARYFQERNIAVFLSEICSHEKCIAALNNAGLDNVEWEAEGHTEKVLTADCIIVSPGIPFDSTILCKARRMNIPVWSEMELGYRATDACFFAVTGSTGKSTTVMLTGEVLAAAGIEHVVAGNIGTPVIEKSPRIGQNGIVIAEVSSFQLETIDQFHPHAAVITNLLKNHLDRYPSEDAYYNAKMEIIRNCTSDDYCIVNACDKRLRTWADTIGKRITVIMFGDDTDDCNTFWMCGTELRYRFQGRSGVIGDLSRMKLKGVHNYNNASVAAALGMIAGATTDAIYRGICTFGGLPHRLEYIADIEGIAWYNDSKSTTAESIGCAVEAFSDGVILIAGGKDKGCDFSVIEQSLRKHVKKAVLIGEAADRIERQWKELVSVERAASLEDAVIRARKNAESGDTVVFSPGCSSFDMFRNYEDRGNQFCSLVKTIYHEQERHHE